AIAALCLPDLQIEREWEGLPAGQSFLAVDPKFQMYARGDVAGQIGVFPLSDLCERARLQGDGKISGFNGFRVSPDGGFLSPQFYDSASGQRGRCFDLATLGTVVQCNQDAIGFDFCGDSKQCAVAFSDGTVRILNLLTGEELRRIPVPGGTYEMQIA